jgi:hypothetical protein
MERHTQDESKKDERVKLILPEGQSMMAVEHTGLDPRFGQFRDRLEALCGLPNQDDLPRILEVSNASALPAIWGRARLPPLEEKAIVIFVASPSLQRIVGLAGFKSSLSMRDGKLTFGGALGWIPATKTHYL